MAQGLTGTGVVTELSITDDTTTNATVFPIWASGTNGFHQTFTSSTKISFNASTGLLTATAFSGSFTGNAATATALQTPRTINGVSFDGTANITITAVADAGTLTGATLASNVLASSLTSVGTLGGLTVTAPIVGSVTGNAATVTTNANLTGAVTSVGNATSLGSFSSANLAAALTDETGTGANVFATSPVLVTPALGTPSSGNLTNCTGFPVETLFTSSDQTLTVSGALTLAHSLGSTPTNIRFFLVCQTAEKNYTAGDIVIVGTTTMVGNQSLSVVPDATNINIRYGSNTGIFGLLDKTTGAVSNITPANWKLRVYATLK